METGYSKADVAVSLPVSYRWTMNGRDVVIFDVKVNGLTSLFDLMPESVRLAIMDKLAATVRGVD